MEAILRAALEREPGPTERGPSSRCPRASPAPRKQIFSSDTRAGTYTWKELIECVKLAKGDELPALLWSAHLGRCIAAALASRSFRPALPTLFSLSTSKAYRPVLSKMERGTDGSYAFHVSLTELPPELNAWPPGELGIVTHVLTLTRMFCWGVLLPFSARVSDLAKRPESRTDIDAAYYEFEAAISNVTVDARNRGLTRGMYVPTLSSDAKERATLLLKEWDDVFREFKELSYAPLKQARDALQIVSKMIIISQEMMKLFARRYAELLEKTLEAPHVGRANTLLFGASTMGILESEDTRLNAEAQ